MSLSLMHHADLFLSPLDFQFFTFPNQSLHLTYLQLYGTIRLKYPWSSSQIFMNVATNPLGKNSEQHIALVVIEECIKNCLIT